LFRFIDDNN